MTPHPSCFLKKCSEAVKYFRQKAPRKKYPYSELFWSVFTRIRIEYGEIIWISSYSVRMPENANQNNSEYGHYLHSEALSKMTDKLNSTPLR